MRKLLDPSDKSKIDRKKMALSAIVVVAMLFVPLFIGNYGANQISYVEVQSIILPSSVDSLSYSPNGSLLAVAYGHYHDYYGIQNKDDPPRWDGAVAIISTESWEIIKTLEGHSGSIGATWRPQGDILATASLDKTVIFWNTSSWEILRRITIPQARDYGPQNQVPFAWSPDGKKFAVSIRDEAIWVYSFVNQTVLGKLIGGPKAILTLAWSPDGCYLVSGGWTSTKIWDTKDLRLVKELGLENSKAVAWRSDGKLLATSGTQTYWASEIGPINSDHKLIIWNTENWKQTDSQKIYYMTSLSWSPDGKKLAVAKTESTCLIYDTNTWALIKEIKPPYGVSRVQWNPNSKELAIAPLAKGTVSIWQEYEEKQDTP